MKRKQPTKDGTRGCGKPGPRPRPRLETTCLVCGAVIWVLPGQRYCKDHKRLRMVRQLEVTLNSRRQCEVQFQPPEPAELLNSAVMSIRILRADGTVDEGRTQIERGRWLTRKLHGPWTEQ